MEKLLAVGIVVILGCLVHFGIALVVAFPIQLCFNEFAPQVFGANAMTYGQALCAYLLVFCLSVAATAQFNFNADD
jgi:hypothetical protein